jgi:hypothetical protein
VSSAIDIPLEFEVLNLGDSSTVGLGRSVELLEGGLDVKTRTNFLPIQPEDAPSTGLEPRHDVPEVGTQDLSIDIGTTTTGEAGVGRSRVTPPPRLATVG